MEKTKVVIIQLLREFRSSIRYNRQPISNSKSDDQLSICYIPGQLVHKLINIENLTHQLTTCATNELLNELIDLLIGQLSE